MQDLHEILCAEISANGKKKHFISRRFARAILRHDEFAFVGRELIRDNEAPIVIVDGGCTPTHRPGAVRVNQLTRIRPVNGPRDPDDSDASQFLAWALTTQVYDLPHLRADVTRLGSLGDPPPLENRGPFKSQISCVPGCPPRTFEPLGGEAPWSRCLPTGARSGF